MIISNVPPYRPEWKGLVESRFPLIDDGLTHWSAGTTHQREKGGRKHRLDGVHTLESFTKSLIYFILKYNRTQLIKTVPPGFSIPRRRSPTTVELWRYGCELAGRPQLADPERVWPCLLPRASGHPTDTGFKALGLTLQVGHRFWKRLVCPRPWPRPARPRNHA